MGFPPPPDAPPVATQKLLSLSAEFVPPQIPSVTIGGSIGIGFTDPLPAIALCGFALPIFGFKLSFTLPPLTFPPPLPDFGISFGLNCSLDNPLSISAHLGYGGGRVSTSDPDPDLAFDQ